MKGFNEAEKAEFLRITGFSDPDKIIHHLVSYEVKSHRIKEGGFMKVVVAYDEEQNDVEEYTLELTEKQTNFHNHAFQSDGERWEWAEAYVKG